MNDLNKEFKENINLFSKEFKSNFEFLIYNFILNQYSKYFKSNGFSQIILFQFLYEYFENFINNMNENITKSISEKLIIMGKVMQDKKDECLLEYLNDFNNPQYPIDRFIELLKEKSPKKKNEKMEIPISKRIFQKSNSQNKK